MNQEYIIRCAGDGCRAFLDNYHGQSGRADGAAFTLFVSDLADAARAVAPPMAVDDWLWWYIGGGAIVVAAMVILLFGTFFTVSQQTVEIIERFGRFKKIAHAGLNVKIPLIDQRVDELSLRVQQLPIAVDTKTLDNVFVELSIAIQYQVLQTAIQDAAYKLDDVEGQIKSYVFDIVRGLVPKMKLDAVFEQKDDISRDVLSELNEKMTAFGYAIVHTPVTEIKPDERVRAAMNEINAAQRLREAATEKGQAEKIIIVKQAEAEKEANILKGEGIAGQRKAMIEGLRTSIEGFKLAIPGIDEREVMQTVMMSQYFDTLKDLPKDGNTRVLLLPHSPNSMQDIGNQLRESLLVTKVD